MENQDRYEAICQLALVYAKAVAKTAVGGDSLGIRVALSYVGMMAAQYSQVTGKEFDVRYSISHGEHGARLHLHETSLVQRTAEPGDEFPQKGSYRQLYENSPLFEMLQRSQTEDETPEETQEDGPCLRL